MPEVTITYKKPETLKILKGLAKYFDFKIASEKVKSVKGITIIPGDASVDTSDMEKLFSEMNLDAKELRKKAWQRTK